ncbi:MAG: 3-deoxy-7-phosphoheptulonate synthase [Gammaproteobacteria bacterium]|nr:MAG: 3-deoxy-7-phosphoheptulonate synthase [Gammaproteobacteria bacterium]
MSKLENVNVIAQDLLPTPNELISKIKLDPQGSANVEKARRTIEDILDGKDKRLLVVAGPCSIHDLDQAKEYAEKLKTLADELKDQLYIVMRVYFEKPRTTVGWKGFINDPDLDDSFNISCGLEKARELLIHLAHMGLPAATEALDPITPQYIGDLIAWTAIGARTAESQTHREMSSGLSSPVGLKNGTDGSLTVAINALKAVSAPHSFLGIDTNGRCAVIRTKGNKYGHTILRGGNKPNYDKASIEHCEAELEKSGLRKKIIVDCSHANSNKDPGQQPLVLDYCVNQIIDGNLSIIGVMLESNLEWGNQPLTEKKSELKYGVSITDACIDWKTTEECLHRTAERLTGILEKR